MLKLKMQVAPTIAFSCLLFANSAYADSIRIIDASTSEDPWVRLADIFVRPNPYPPFIDANFVFTYERMRLLKSTLDHFLDPLSVERIMKFCERDQNAARFWTFFFAANVDKLDSVAETLDIIIAQPHQFIQSFMPLSDAELTKLYLDAYPVMEAIESYFDDEPLGKSKLWMRLNRIHRSVDREHHFPRLHHTPYEAQKICSRFVEKIAPNAPREKDLSDK